MRPVSILLLFSFALVPPSLAQGPAQHGRRYDRLLIRDVHVIDGNGTPVRGPMNVMVEGDRITRVGGFRPGRDVDAIIEGEGRYLMP